MGVNKELRDFIRAAPIKSAVSRFEFKTCVGIALISRDYKMFKILLGVKYNCKYRILPSEPKLPQLLFECCHLGLTKYAKILLDLGANPKEIKFGRTPLIKAAEYGQTEMVRFLLPISNVDCSVAGRSALGIAAENNFTDIVSDILAVSTFNMDSVLNSAAAKGHIDTVRLLLQAGASTTCGRGAMSYAVRGNHPSVVRELLIYPGIDIENCYGSTPLMKSVSISLEMVRLVSSMANNNIRDIDGYTALMHAVNFGKLDVVMELAPNTDLDIQSVNGHSALMIAVRKNNLEIVDYLLDFNSAKRYYKSGEHALLTRNINLNLRNSNGQTALMIAVRRGYQPIVARLLTAYYNKGDINMTDKNGLTAAFMAYANKNKEIGDMFRPFCDVPSKNQTQLTPFLIACMNGNVSGIKTSKSNFINQRNKIGMTPLMIAAACGHVDLIKLLCVQPNINIRMVDKRNYHAMDYAVKYGIRAVRALAPYFLKLH